MKAWRTTQKKGAAVFEGLGLHPSVFGESKRREGSERACTEYATRRDKKRDRERKIGVATCQRWMAHPSGPALNVDHFPSIHHLSVGDMCQSISRVNTRRPRNDYVFISVCSESLCSFIARCGEKI